MHPTSGEIHHKGYTPGAAHVALIKVPIAHTTIETRTSEWHPKGTNIDTIDRLGRGGGGTGDRKALLLHTSFVCIIVS